MITEEIKEEIKYRCDIVDVISAYVPLKRAGSNYTGRCPFHSERSPSFTVFPSTKSFYCFGCGAGGDVFTFMMKRENIEYRAAVELLAKRAGIELPPDNEPRSQDSVRRERVLNMNREAARFYHACLYSDVGKAGLDYLTKRGLSGAVIKHFGLGFAPDGFGAVTSHLMRLGYTAEEMSSAFLCGISRKNNRPYDYFRNRVIFPIIDVTGNVVAFGGRVMDGSLPKYLNTSDTPAFKKSRNLFALNFAKSKCAERLILCEGYMDVIALHAHGFENAVATLGTAITPEQARIMSKYTKQVIISYDSDEAGQRATSKAIKLLTEAGLDVRVLRIPGAKDPDEFLQKNGSTAHEKFKLLLDQSRAQFEFKLESVLARHDISIVDERIKAAAELCSIIAEVYSDAEREVYIGVVSDRLDIQRDSLKNDVKRIMRSRQKTQKNEEMQEIIRKTSGFGDSVNSDTIKNVLAVSTEENLLGILLLYPENMRSIKRGELKLSADDFYSEFNRRVFSEMMNRYSEARQFDFGDLAEVFNPDEMGRITSMLVRRQQLTTNDSVVLSELIERLRSETKQKRLEETGDQIDLINEILTKKGKKPRQS
ncbi:MAG: DNA primase [Clostridiales bacterium]|nr:DNA primase [Clostridiales bacterium]